MKPFRNAYAERWWILITTTILVTLVWTAGMFSGLPMFVCASWHHRSKKIQNWEGKSTTFWRCIIVFALGVPTKCDEDCSNRGLCNNSTFSLKWLKDKHWQSWKKVDITFQAVSLYLDRSVCHWIRLYNDKCNYQRCFHNSHHSYMDCLLHTHWYLVK